MDIDVEEQEHKLADDEACEDQCILGSHSAWSNGTDTRSHFRCSEVEGEEEDEREEERVRQRPGQRGGEEGSKVDSFQQHKTSH